VRIQLKVYSCLVLASVAAGCTGVLGTPAGPSTDGPPPSGGNLGGANGSDGSSANPSLGRTGPQRLNNIEYNNTVHDLLGTKLTPASTFVAEEASGFDNVASALGMTGSQYESYFGAAETLSADVFAQPKLRSAVFPCTPTDGDGGSCLHDSLSQFLLRAFRRPPLDSELTGLQKVYDSLRAGGVSVDDALAGVLTTTLASPQFLYRFGSGQGVDDYAGSKGYALAARLSYFLWSSMPDAQLFELAADGSLDDDETLRAQVTRMLADKRASALLDNFAGQWLGIRELATHKVLADNYPLWNDQLRASMGAEAKAYFSEFLFKDAPLADFFSSNVHYLDGTLGKHYGVADVQGTDLVRIDRDLGQRTGFFGLGAFLTVSSFAQRTSPTLRAKWILEELLCSPPAPPPPGVKANLEDSDSANAAASIDNVRERLELHRSNPACAGCHAAMDPIGLALESFDGIGASRDKYPNGDAVDTNGELPTGEKFNGPVELSDVIAGDPRFAHCATQKMLVYGLSRAVALKDPLVDQIEQSFLGSGGTLRALVTTIVLSDAFRITP
jgi:hypothetical protein